MTLIFIFFINPPVLSGERGIRSREFSLRQELFPITIPN